MSDDGPRDEEVEAAAKAIWRKVHAKDNRWESNMDALKETYRSQARAAITAYISVADPKGGQQ